MFHSTDLSVCCYLPFPCRSLTLTTGQAFERSPNSSKESRANDDREGSSSYHCQNEWEKRRDSGWIRKGFILLRWSEPRSNESQTSKYIDGSALWLMHCLCRSVQGKGRSPVCAGAVVIVPAVTCADPAGSEPATAIFHWYKGLCNTSFRKLLF